MPYHPDSTTRALFIKDHIHTPTSLEEVVCSICRQRCTDRHQAVQITAHPQCQCVFGKTCLLQWLRSNSAASSACPSCRAVLYNANVDGSEENDSGEDRDDDSEEENAGDDGLRGRQKIRQEKGGRIRRRTPSTSLSRSSSSSSSSSSDSSDILPPHPHDVRSHRHCRPSPSSSSRTLSASATLAADIDTLVTDLWAGTWDLVAESWSLTPAGARRSGKITRAQLIMLVHDVNPFEEELENAVVEHLIIRARKMVVKHRRTAQFDDEAELRIEREDVRLAIGYGV